MRLAFVNSIQIFTHTFTFTVRNINLRQRSTASFACENRSKNSGFNRKMGNTKWKVEITYSRDLETASIIDESWYASHKASIISVLDKVLPINTQIIA